MRAGDAVDQGAPAGSNGGEGSSTAGAAAPKKMSGQTPRDGPLYSPADRHGNFSTAVAEEDVRVSSLAEYDHDELEFDPSERRPGGPVAEAVHAMGAGARRLKWAVPVAMLLAAFLVQSIGLYVATSRYVSWMDHITATYEAEAPLVLRLNKTGSVEGQLLASYKETITDIASKLTLPDGFAEWLRQGTPEEQGWLMPMMLDVLSGIVIPLLWAHDAVQSRNLRLWTRTLLVGSIIVALKGALAWATVVPDSDSLVSCRERLDGVSFQGGNPVFDFFTGLWNILFLWVSSVFYGIMIPIRRYVRHTQSKYSVCADMFLSGPTSLCALFSLGLYDVARTTTRKQKPHFRCVYRAGIGLLLTILVVADALAQLTTRQQYTMDVVLALVLTMLLYSSPLIAICVDRWLVYGSLISQGDAKDPCDKGDVVIPPCCLPFCCVHGRYFLYSTSVREAEAALRNQAAMLAEEFRLQQEEAAQRVLELEASIESEWQRAEEDAAEAEKRLQEALAESLKAFEQKVAHGLRQLETQVKAEKEAAEQLEKQAANHLQSASELEERLKEERSKLLKEVEAASEVAKTECDAAARAEVLAQQELQDAEDLQRHLEELALAEEPKA